MRKLSPLLLVAALLVGCGGGDDNPVERGAIGLTEWLPKGGSSYDAIDVAAYKEELGLPEDADPTNEETLEERIPAFNLLLILDKSRSEAIIDAIGPADVTAAAVAIPDDTTPVAAFATTGDEGEIGSRLGDLGYRDANGVLEHEEGGTAFRLEEGIVFVSDDPTSLREIPEEQRDDPPLELLGELDGDALYVSRVEDGECFTEIGAARRADGTAELAVLVPGGAEAERMTPDTGGLGEAEADGDVVTKPVNEPGDGNAFDLIAEFFPGYECE